MYYLIKSILGIFVTTMDKKEMLSNIRMIESDIVKDSSGNKVYDAKKRLQFINDVLYFLDTAFTKGLYHVEKWKEKIYQSFKKENEIFGYSWTQTEACYVLLKVKELLMQVNTIPSSELPTCRDEVSIPNPHENHNRQEQEHNTEKISEHTASAIVHAGMLIHARDTYNFYNEIVTKLESEQIILCRQLSPYETQLLNWAKEERGYAKKAGIKDGFKAVIYGASNIA